MKLSSAYLYEQLKKEYEIADSYGISGRDGYLRPFLYRKNTADQRGGRVHGHICVVPLEEYPERVEPDIFYIICCQKVDNSYMRNDGILDAWGEQKEHPCLYVLQKEDSPADILNLLQQIYDDCEAWDERVDDLVIGNAGMDKVLQEMAEFLGNPVFVMGLDFSLSAEAGMEKLPDKARLFTEDGLNMEYMNALVQSSAYEMLVKEKHTVLYRDHSSGLRTLNRNLMTDGQPTHRVVMTEGDTELTPGKICLMEAVVSRLEYLVSHENANSKAGTLEQIFQKLLTDRTADYVQVSRQLSAAGWGKNHRYQCLLLQITYLNQKLLSTKAICRYIQKQLPDSISFFYQDEVVTYFNLTRLELTEEEVAAKMVYFIRDSYLKAGYSRVMQGHMNLRRQYVQARTAIDVGGRKKPYLWIHHFNQVAMPYIMEQITRRLPGSMLCHEGLLRLQRSDRENRTEYVRTLKVYLDQHLNASQTANVLFIHRSTFLYRMEKIREILQSEMDDPEEIFYLELSMRLLEQEEEKN
ncbi:MAG: helix-turn-helix domain-containing protein [Eubacteriales bacterium]|nr:helix-turn-helix domain-containing protein [Eubacteriales bacterium]